MQMRTSNVLLVHFAACGHFEFDRSSAMGNLEYRPEAKDAPAPPPRTLRGFHNLGNTCYLGSVVVALSALPAFVDTLADFALWESHSFDIQVDEVSPLFHFLKMCD